MSALDYADELRRLSRLLDQGLAALREQAQEMADAEHDYRLKKAQAFAYAPKGTVPAMEAWVDGECASERRRRDLAEHLQRAALEAVRSRRTQVSATQTLINAEAEEAKFAHTGYEMSA